MTYPEAIAFLGFCGMCAVAIWAIAGLGVTGDHCDPPRYDPMTWTWKETTTKPVTKADAKPKSDHEARD